MVDISNIKALLSITDSSKDTILTTLIKHATEEAKNYTHQETIDGLESCVEQMVIYNYRRLDNKELQSENYSGVSFHYTDDYPKSIIRELKSHRRARFL